MKTSTFTFPKHYQEASEGVLKLLEQKTVDVPDLFYLRYSQEKTTYPVQALETFAKQVSQYIKGFWCDIFVEGLERHFCEDPNIHKVRQVAAELFDVQLP